MPLGDVGHLGNEVVTQHIRCQAGRDCVLFVARILDSTATTTEVAELKRPRITGIRKLLMTWLLSLSVETQSTFPQRALCANSPPPSNH